jgi:hypothetical protein
VSKIVNNINPRVPTKPKNIDKADKIFWPFVVFLTIRPECLSHRSERRDASRNIVVTQDPVMNSGFSISAPTSFKAVS